ncbi:MAG: Grx4 family monothiol glutaredoxin [Proteobacteria bacterium]|jgi:monothiol glutaredoxin|nr:Grx4 family monothiol glutaredoxin [Pseudomonadota bacterium]
MTHEEAKQLIQNTISSNDIALFMKGTADMPMCGFSGRVVQILNHFGVQFKGVNILEDDMLRQTVKDFSNWPTLPQLYIKGEFVGGCDIVTEMAQTGELETLLKEKQIKVSKNS